MKRGAHVDRIANERERRIGCELVQALGELTAEESRSDGDTDRAANKLCR